MTNLSDKLQIVPANAEAAFIPPPEPPKAKPESASLTLEEVIERNEALTEKVEALDAVLAKPLAEILADREKAEEAALAWDRFGAMWMLSQRAMRRVALDLAAQLGVSEEEVVARAMANANAVLNGADEVDLGGTVAPAQMQHIARHRNFLRKQFK